ncbi:MAG: NAD(P)H-dependent glycerol-3-phosphate dehydrogenase [Gammaproteobacteria bacterium]
MEAVKFCVIGSGSWGTALAIHLARCGHRVFIWGPETDQLEAMERDRRNDQFLPGINLPDSLTPEYDLSTAVNAADVILMAAPSHVFESALLNLKPLLKPSSKFMWATKGFTKEGEFLHAVVERVCPELPYAVLSGPSFALEVAKGLPTMVTAASKDLEYAKEIAGYFSNSNFRVYTSNDVIGVQVGCAVKNVLAVAVGISDGLGYGANTRSALMTRGLAAMMRLGESLGARRETLMGLSGLGDMILTCTDDLSRNRRFGLALGKGQSIDEAVKAIGQVVESIHTVDQVLKLAAQHDIEMPIVEQVKSIISGNIKPDQALEILFNRPLTQEF